MPPCHESVAQLHFDHHSESLAGTRCPEQRRIMNTDTRIGLSGLGTLASALSLNIDGKGFRLPVSNLTADVSRRFHAEAGALADRVIPTECLAGLVLAIAPPRAITMLGCVCQAE